jgi:hypothetical protein
LSTYSIDTEGPATALSVFFIMLPKGDILFSLSPQRQPGRTEEKTPKRFMSSSYNISPDGIKSNGLSY